MTELRVEFVSRSETYFVVNDQFKATWNARQRIKPSSTLLRDPKTCSGALQELNKASAFWRYQFLQRAAHLDSQTASPPGQVTFWPEPGYIVRQSLLSFISNSWPRWGRLPEREQSQLVLDQVLLWTCKP